MAPYQPLCEIDINNQFTVNYLNFRLLTSENLLNMQALTSFFIFPKQGVISNTKLRLIELSGFFLAAIAKIYRTLVVGARLKVQIKLWEFYAFLKQTTGILAREILSSNTDSHIKSSII